MERNYECIIIAGKTDQNLSAGFQNGFCFYFFQRLLIFISHLCNNSEHHLITTTLLTGGSGGTGANHIKAMTNKATKAAIIPIPMMTVFWSWSSSIFPTLMNFYAKIYRDFLHLISLSFNHTASPAFPEENSFFPASCLLLSAHRESFDYLMIC
jgi:hypothetical protein